MMHGVARDLRIPRWVFTVAGLLSLLVAASCGDADVVEPVDEGPEPRPEVRLSWDRPRCRHPCGTQGVLGRVTLNAEVVDQNGDPWLDQTVHWRIRDGGGALDWFVDGGRDWPPPSSRADTMVTRSLTMGGGPDWRLGGVVGTQAVQAWVEGSDTAVTAVVTVPGAVFVAAVPRDVWFFDSLPADTLRIHVADLDNIAIARQLLEEFETVHVSGSVMPGTGLDPNWIFHLEPSSVQALRPDGFIPTCVGLPWSEETLESTLTHEGARWRSVCQQFLHLARIDAVPGGYLDEIRDR